MDLKARAIGTYWITLFGSWSLSALIEAHSHYPSVRMAYDFVWITRWLLLAPLFLVALVRLIALLLPGLDNFSNHTAIVQPAPQKEVTPSGSVNLAEEEKNRRLQIQAEDEQRIRRLAIQRERADQEEEKRRLKKKSRTAKDAVRSALDEF